MLIKKPDAIKSSEITPETVYLQRRVFMRTALYTGAAGALAASVPGFVLGKEKNPSGTAQLAPLGKISKSPYPTTEELTPFEDITTYNNFYEFRTDKSDPAGSNRGRGASLLQVNVQIPESTTWKIS